MPKGLTKEQFINKSTMIHGNFYDYSKVIYKNNLQKVEIICPIHGSFYLAPGKHMQGRKCQSCSGGKINTKEFVLRANKKHNFKYDYSLSVYSGMLNEITIICPIHGKFVQTADAHLRTNGCNECGIKEGAKNRTYTTDEFIHIASKIHFNKYDYSKTQYINHGKPVIITCPIHGDFFQTPDNHCSGKGCTKCCESQGEKEIRNILLKNNISFISQKKFKDCFKKNYLPFDFYLPDYSMCIEFDGLQHYKPIEWFGGTKGFNERKENDNIKAKFCKKNDIKLIRVKYNQDIFKKLKKYISSLKP